MKKPITIALLGTIETTTDYADDLIAKIVNESVTNYSNNVETDTDNNTN
ncbi:hypothetical protein [Francisella tularensis]|nr:hypothetical protein [Francisella tularensis]MBD2809079.1 hypothetical protein [Francisella tularensis]